LVERLERFRAIDKLGESWNNEIEPIENDHLKVAE